MIVIWGFLTGNPYKPGPPWVVLNSVNTEYICSNNVKNSSGTTITVAGTVLSSNGSVYNPI